MNDRHLLVGDVSEFSICGRSCSNGMVYAYKRNAGGDWVLRQLVAPAALGPFFQFGGSIALDGDRALISASRLTVGGPAVYEFVYDGEQWVETDILLPPEGRTFGGVIALRDDTALIHDSRVEDLLVYQMEDGQWELVGELSNPDVPVGLTSYGFSVAIDEDWLIVGARSEAAIAPSGGAAYVYRRQPDGGFILTQKLIASDVISSPRFAASLTIQGNQLFVGAPLSDRAFQDQGVVHIYELLDGRWEHTDELTHDQADGHDNFGMALDVHDDRLIVGTVRDRPAGFLGAAYLFQRGINGHWTQAADLFPDRVTGVYAGDVEIWGLTAAVGDRDAMVGEGTPGMVDVFDLSCLTCRPDLDADGTLTIFDFLTFLNAFAAGDPLADFDGDGDLTLFDFLAFQTAFAVGCE